MKLSGYILTLDDIPIRDSVTGDLVLYDSIENALIVANKTKNPLQVKRVEIEIFDLIDYGNRNGKS